MLCISPRTQLPQACSRSPATLGFSLLEVLIVICLIGIICAGGIGWYASAHMEVLERVTHQRNAQEIVSLGVCATVSGADFVVSDNKQATVQNLIAGTVGKHGPWKGKTFRLTSLQPEALPEALAFVKFDSGLLLYDPTGGQL